ncbi:hypothetical protein ABPG72_018649 [Tetrahymena utriculariae]
MENKDIQAHILQIQQGQEDITEINQQQHDSQNNSQKKKKAIILLYCYYIFIMFQISYSTSFGFLLYQFSKNDEMNNSCEYDAFKKWSYTCSIFCFVSTSFQILRFINRCKNKSHYNDQEMTCSKFYDLLEYLATIGLFACSFGLYIECDSSCGNLYILAKIFYILTFSIIAVAVFSICIVLCRIKQG